MRRGIEFVITNYKTFLLIILLLTIPFSYFYSQQRYLSSIEVYFESDDTEIDYYKTFQRTFGNEEIVSVVFNSEDIFTVDNLNRIRLITDAITSVQGIHRVYSLTSSELIKGYADVVDFEMLIPRGPITKKTAALAKENVFSKYAIFKTIISEDGTTTAILAELKSGLSIAEKKTILVRLKKAASGAAGDGIRLHYAGSLCIDMEINRLTFLDNITFTPVAFIIIFFLTLFLIKDITLAILCQINILLVVIWSTGLLVMTGETINSVTVIIPPVLLAISTADAIHILTYYKKKYQISGMTHNAAVLDAINALWLPCLFTSITTAIGYFSFLITTVRPVKMVGIYTGSGLLIAFVMSVTFFPAALVAARRLLTRRSRAISGPAISGKESSYLTAFGRIVIRHHKIITISFLIITIVSACGIYRINFETDFAGYLRDTNPVKQDMLFVEGHLRGTVPVEVVLTALDEKDDFTHPDSIKMVEAVQLGIINNMKGRYTSSYSLADYLKTSHMAFNNGSEDYFVLPENRHEIIDYQEFSDDRLLSKYLSIDRMETRISLTSYLGSTDSYRLFEDYLASEVGLMLDGKYDYKFTGVAALYTQMDSNLRTSQVNSFAVALILIFLMMVFVCRDIQLAAISMIPNFFPVFVTLGMMGWLDIPLDVSTIMIASVTIGIAVDDTIHFVTWLRRNRMAGMDLESSVIKTFKDTGRPIIMTSVILCSAYFVLMTGSVKPIIAFGTLAGFAMLLALIGDLCILPAIIMVFKPSVIKKIKKKR